jgi:hypothetical protein
MCGVGNVGNKHALLTGLELLPSRLKLYLTGRLLPLTLRRVNIRLHLTGIATSRHVNVDMSCRVAYTPKNFSRIGRASCEIGNDKKRRSKSGRVHCHRRQGHARQRLRGGGDEGTCS